MNKEKPEYFLDKFNNKKVKIVLTDGTKLDGYLYTNVWNKFEIYIKALNGDYIIMKHAINYIISNQ